MEQKKWTELGTELYKMLALMATAGFTHHVYSWLKYSLHSTNTVLLKNICTSPFYKKYPQKLTLKTMFENNFGKLD